MFGWCWRLAKAGITGAVPALNYRTDKELRNAIAELKEKVLWAIWHQPDRQQVKFQAPGTVERLAWIWRLTM
jgi:hypothetical protein